jgi:hypothetical protein
VIELGGKRYVVCRFLDNQSVLVRDDETGESKVLHIRNITSSASLPVDDFQTLLDIPLIRLDNKNRQPEDIENDGATLDEWGSHEEGRGRSLAVQINHDQFDVALLDENQSCCGRPWLTAVIDRYSGSLIGFHIALGEA